MGRSSDQDYENLANIVLGIKGAEILLDNGIFQLATRWDAEVEPDVAQHLLTRQENIIDGTMPQDVLKFI